MTIYDDEIDLRPYILSIVRNWWIIALVALIFAAGAFVITRYQEVTYQATASILLTRSRATLELAERFPTVNEPVDARSRMDALLSIANSDALAVAVAEELNTNPSVQLGSYNSIKSQVKLSEKGDIIFVTATADSPKTAALIANTWAERAVAEINTAYRGEEPLSEIQNQLAVARDEYSSAQAAYEAHLERNHINLLEQQVAEARALFTNLAEDRTRQIDYFTDRKQKMEDLKIQAEALQQQLQSGNRSEAGNIGDALAVLISRANSLGISPTNKDTLSSNIGQAGTGEANTSNPLNFNFDLNNTPSYSLQITDLETLKDTSSNYVADINPLIELSTLEITKADEALENLRQNIVQGGGNETIEEVAAQLRSLETQLESERSERRELSSQRDLAWQAYQAITQKEAELKNAAQSSNQVSLASPAIPPESPVATGTIRNVLVAAAIGLAVGTLFIIAIQWWRSLMASTQERAPSLSSD